MKGNHQTANIIIRQVYLPQLIKFKSANLILSVCWIVLVLCGALVIGACASNYRLSFQACLQTQTFCTNYFTLTSQRQLYFYIKLYPFYQNNRIFLDSYSSEQLHGNVGNADKCGDFTNYKSLGITETVGGYRVPELTNVHPCGQPMKYILNDMLILIDKDGGTPNLDSGNLVSKFYTDNHFIRLENYQLSQWVDVSLASFANWFVIPMTNVKYVLVGRIKLQAGDYQLILRNNYVTNDEFKKQIIVTEIGPLGDTNLVLGFSIFSTGITLLFLHVIVCCKQKKR